MRVVDSHLHLWDPELLEYDWLEGPLDRRFAEEEFLAERLEGIEEETAVFVQADPVPELSLDEVRWADAISSPAGVVAIVAGARLDRGTETEQQLAALASFERVVGVRHLLQGEPAGFALGEDFLRGAREVSRRGWTFDACVRADQLGEVAALAASVPELPVVLDHLGKPAIGTATDPAAPSETWAEDLRALGAHPQVFCKLSGLPAEAGGVWTDAQVRPFLDAALAAFGPRRLMWGSDWPVSSIDADHGVHAAHSRQRWFRTVAEWAACRGISVDDVFQRNALSFYRIR
ncbi:amidohydrolase family protein [Microbacterium soli]|uniref:Amidohydrolase family protein n=1 Tax=Microbacterium soli TaxID=446075 RepID=A0ABP7N6A5_9MICO